MSEENGPKHLPVENELYCFMDHDRPCQADCMAYKTMPDENKHLDPGQQHCVLLDSVEKAGHGLQVLAAVFGTWMKKQQTKEADAKREAAMSGARPPAPTGGQG